jgi:hypothetical protein
VPYTGNQQVPYNQPVPYDPQAAHRQQAAYNQQAARSQQPGAQQQAIQMQPQRQKQNPNFQETQIMYDQDGEEIIFEGVCYSCGVCWDVCWLWMFVLVPVIVGILFGVPISVCCGIKAIKNWKLHVTRTSIKYRKPTGICCETNVVIPFRDIKDIFVSNSCGTKDVLVRMDPRKINEYLGCWNKPMCMKLDCLVLSNVTNGHDLVEVVKRQIAL